MARSSLSLFERFFSSKKKKGQGAQEPVVDSLIASEVTPELPSVVPHAAVTQSFAVPSAIADKAVAAVPPQNKISEQVTGVAPATAVDATGVAVAQPAVASTVDADGLSTAAAAAAPSETASMNAEQQDTELEYNSMVLLSKLEQLVIRLSDNAVQKSMPLVIDALVELTNHLAEFSDRLPVAATQKVSLAALIDRDVENYAQLRSQYVQANRLVLGAAESGFGQDPGAFQQLSNDMLRVVNIYLSASVKAFHTPRISEQWKTLYTGFFVNLSKAVRSAQDIQQEQ